jgi:hypothetical protein
VETGFKGERKVREESSYSEEEMIRWLNEKNHELGFEVLLSLLRNTRERVKGQTGVGISDGYTWRFSSIVAVAMEYERKGEKREMNEWHPSRLVALEKRIEQLELTVLRGND